MKPYYEDEAVTLYHGNSLELLPHLKSAGADLTITDPPYNVGQDYGTTSDDLSDAEYASQMATVVTEARRLTHNQAWVTPRYKMALWWSLLPDAHEVVIPMRAGNAIRQGWSSKFSVVLIVGLPFTETHPDDLWEGIRHRGEGYFFTEDTYGHPGYTPYAIMAKCIKLLTSPNEVILDPFAGTGTALRAAKDLGRKAIGIEIEERYCEIAAKRMAQTVMALP